MMRISKEYFIYTYGEADGPFECQHNDAKGKSDCNENTWSIYTKTKMCPREALRSGTALCSKHETKVELEYLMRAWRWCLVFRRFW